MVHVGLVKISCIIDGVIKMFKIQICNIIEINQARISVSFEK